MSFLGQSAKDRQIAIVYVANAVMRKAQGDRLDVANVPGEVMSGVFERLRYAGVRHTMEGRFLVVRP